MAMWTIIIKNSGGSAIEIQDLGISIPAAGQVELSDQFTFPQIAGSDDLRGLVSAGTLVLNDGVADLNASTGEAFLTIVQREYLADNYYNKTELNSAGGGGAIHWDNVTNKPAYGQPDGWERPVKYRVLGTGLSTAPTTPATGDVYVDNTAKYLKWDGAAWQEEGTAAAGERVIDLSDGDESILEWDGSLWQDQGTPTDAYAVIVDDDGDGKGAQYVYSSTASQWDKIGDLDWADHFNGGAGKHDASEIDVEGVYTNIPGTPTNLESTISAVDSKIGAQDTAIQNVDLDSAYDKAGAGLGRTITVDQGPVKLDSSGATNAPLELTPKATRSSSGLAGGQLEIGTDGILYAYDASRSKWLSVQRVNLVFGRKGQSKDQFLPFGGGTLPSNNSGYRMLRNAVITGMSGQLDSSGSCSLHCRSNDAATNIATLTLASELGNQRTDLNVNLSAGDYLQNYLEATSRVNDPVVIVEIAWRG